MLVNTSVTYVKCGETVLMGVVVHCEINSVTNLTFFCLRAGDSRLVCTLCRTYVAPDVVRKCHWCEHQFCATHVWDGVDHWKTTSAFSHDMCDKCIDEVGEMENWRK